MTKLILTLAVIAALWPAAAGAQARLNGDQLAYRMLHPDCIFPDLQGNPDFRLCGRHFLGEPGIVVVKGDRDDISIKVQDFDGEPYSEQEPYPAAVLLDSAWLNVEPFFSFNRLNSRWPPTQSPPDDQGRHSLRIRVHAYARDTAGRRVVRWYDPIVRVPLPGLDEYVEGGINADRTYLVDSMNDWLARTAAIHGCASIDECLAAYPWFYRSNPSQSWSLTNEQVARVARVIQLRIVNEACNVGLSAQAPSDYVVLRLREDGRIGGSCEPRPSGGGRYSFNQGPYSDSACWYPDYDRPGYLCIGQPEPEGDRP